jgi:mannose-6-phosphate isomerase
VRALALANARRHGDARDDAFAAADVPFAELWCGTHASGMSDVVAADGARASLRAHVRDAPAATLGASTRARFGDDVPFLVKVLSVARALSVQAHPDKALAARLHARDPAAYADENHKPEMALCVSATFEALSGFATARATLDATTRHPELARAIGDDAALDALRRAVAHEKDENSAVTRAAFKRVFTALMTAERERVETTLRALETRVRDGGATATSSSSVESLFLRLCEQYPGDVGAFCAFVMNHVTLRPGEALVMAANEPHAYLSGECVEVMATSDNVVRAGLTPKFRDVGVLCDMLTYALGAPAILTGEVVDARTRRYVPPFDEFRLDVLTVAPGAAHDVRANPGPSLWIVYRGSGALTSATRAAPIVAAPGAAFFVAADEACAVVVDAAASDDFVAFIATTNA